jgi:hypothetical protein
MKNISLKLTLIFIFGMALQAYTQSGLSEDESKNNQAGFSLLTIYPADIQTFGIGFESQFRHSLNKRFFYTISMGYGVAYAEHEGGQQFTYGITGTTIDHYAHYLATAALGIDVFRTEKHQIGCSLGLAGRYNSTLYFRYAYHPLTDREYHEYYFIPEMIEGYDAGLLGEISYSRFLNDKLALELNCRYIVSGRFAYLMSAGISCQYRF